jgi:hypothetical protein
MTKEFKKGDVVIVTATKEEMYRKNRYKGAFCKDYVGIVNGVGNRYVALLGETAGWTIDKSQVEHYAPTQEPIPHAELRIAHAKGYEIEYESQHFGWEYNSTPTFDPSTNYRIKQPEPKQSKTQLKIAELESRLEEMQRTIQKLREIGGS